MVESGDDLTPCQEKGTRTLILANHQSTADVPLFMACFNAKPDVLPNIMWIMDRVFKFTNFGIVSVLHRDFFVQAVSTFFSLFFFSIHSILLCFIFEKNFAHSFYIWNVLVFPFVGTKNARCNRGKFKESFAWYIFTVRTTLDGAVSGGWFSAKAPRSEPKVCGKE